MNEERDQRLVDACLKGDTRAFEEIVTNYQKPLYSAAYRIVEDQDEAEDILQNAFIKAYENLKTYKKSYKLFSWLYRITLNEALNTLHSKKRFEGLHGEYQSHEKTGDEVLQESELSSALDCALRELKLEYRLVIILNHFHDRSYTEMGFILNIPVKTVKSRLFTARNMLRELLVHNK